MKNKKNIIILGMVILLLIIAFVCYKLLNNDSGYTTIDRNIIIENNVIDWDTYSTYDLDTVNEDIEISKEGIYTLNGTINGKLIVKTSGNVKIILDNAIINSDNGPCILVQEADNVEIELKENTTNILTDSTNYSNYLEENGTIFSHDNLELSGNGTLIINANYEDAIVSKDDLIISGGTYKIESKDDAIKGKDSVYIKDGNITINALGDAIKSTNDTDEDKGYILIENGIFEITSVNDAFDAQTKLVIKDGTFNLTTTGSSSEESHKGLKANVLIDISGGTFDINTKDDGIHSNKNIIIDKGNITIESSDDGIHADGLIEINDGTITINAHEGFEATYVKINGGDINITSSDDGINAGNKSDEYDVTVEINGGTLTIVMGNGDTDGIDSNGDLYINGGTINITGQNAFDYDGTAEYNGGTIIVNGETTNTITNQFGGMGGPNGGMSNNPRERR